MFNLLNTKKIGLIGLGYNGKKILNNICKSNRVNVVEWDNKLKDELKEELRLNTENNKINFTNYEQVSKSDVLIINTSKDNIEQICYHINPHLKNNTIIFSNICGYNYNKLQSLQNRNLLPFYQTIVKISPNIINGKMETISLYEEREYNCFNYKFTELEQYTKSIFPTIKTLWIKDENRCRPLIQSKSDKTQNNKTQNNKTQNNNTNLFDSIRSLSNDDYYESDYLLNGRKRFPEDF